MNIKEQAKIVKKWANQQVLLENTTHFRGQTGKVTNIDFADDSPNAIYGYSVTITLDSGKEVTAYKFDGLTIR